MTHHATTEMGLPCRDCRGTREDRWGGACPSCGGTGHGTCLRLPLGYLAEITPGLAGWSWTILRHGTPADGGIAATRQLATAAADRWADAELDRIADILTYAILLAAVAEFGRTDTAFAAAFAAVALTDAIEAP